MLEKERGRKTEGKGEVGAYTQRLIDSLVDLRGREKLGKEGRRSQREEGTRAAALSTPATSPLHPGLSNPAGCSFFSYS